MSRVRMGALAWRGTAALLLLGGCEAPIGTDRGDDQLRGAIEAAIARQGADPPAPGEATPLRPVTQDTSKIVEKLAPRLAELDALGPQARDGGAGLPLGVDVSDGADPVVQVSLRSAMLAAVRNNLSLQGARIEQAVAEADVVKAEAAFDAVLLAGTGYQLSKLPPPPINIPGGLNNAFAQENSQTTVSTGIQKRLVSGGTINASFNSNYTQQSIQSIYNPANYWTNSVNFNINQPLLQGFGSDVNEAQIRLAQNRDRAAVVSLRKTLLDLVAQVETQYWTLVSARQQVVASAWLVKVGDDVRSVLERRMNFDATVADYALAVAIVEQRKSALIRACLRARDESDRLKLLMNDPAASVGSETVLVPVDTMCQEAIRYNLREALVSTMEQNPSIATALLRIDDASIGMVVADNGRLPQLGLQAGVTLTGQDTNPGSGSFGGAMNEIADANFVSYLGQLAFSQPIGNRAAEAEYRRARLARSGAVIAYQSAIENAVFTVKTSLRSVVASFELIEQTRASRIAAAESVRSLAAFEETLALLTPEFLQTKFVAQDRLASAWLAEIDAKVGYNSALARLYNAMGTGLTMNRIDLAVIEGAP